MASLAGNFIVPNNIHVIKRHFTLMSTISWDVTSHRLAYSSTLMKEVRHSELSTNFYQSYTPSGPRRQNSSIVTAVRTSYLIHLEICASHIRNDTKRTAFTVSVRIANLTSSLCSFVQWKRDKEHVRTDTFSPPFSTQSPTAQFEK
jgi:hypothetical protein